MIFRFSSFLALLATGVVLTTTPPVLAQQAPPSAASRANSFLPSAGKSSADNTPNPLFNFDEPTISFDLLPNATAPSVSPETAKQWKKILETKNNWALMTPKEIMGLPTPEKILGLPAPNNEDNLSPEQRFLSRQDRAVATAATNAQVRSDAALLENEANPFLPNNRSGQASRLGDGPDFHSTPNANLRPDGQTGADQRDISPWTSAFTVPPAAPKPSSEQQAAMERFRALMEPSSPAETTPARPVTSTTPLPDPNLQPQPLVNPLGHSFTPLQSSIGRPTGIMPLPGITGPYKTPAPSKSSSQAQLPPWLSDSPPPFGASPRKF